MKTIIYKSAACAAALLLMSSCSDYLKETSGSLLIPKNATEYQSVLYGEAYPNGSFTNDVEWFDAMTDDMMCTPQAPKDAGTSDMSSTLAVGRGFYTWAQDVEYYYTGYPSFYETRYRNIMACNTIIEKAQEMQGEPGDIAKCVAQAYTLRAFNYWYLVNLYGLPYNEATADTDMGVIIRTKSEVVRDQPQRSTVAQVYELINQDLDQALELFDQASSTRSLFEVTKKVAQLMKCRVGLDMKKWDEVIKYGEELADGDYGLYDITKLTEDDLEDYCFLNRLNTEIFFSYGEAGEIRNHSAMQEGIIAMGVQFYNGAAFHTSDDLVNLYEDGDNRRVVFFGHDEVDPGLPDWGIPESWTCYRNAPTKHNQFQSESEVYTSAMRTSEVLLSVAEAYVQKGGEGLQKAADLLNTLRKARFTAATYSDIAPSSFASQQDFLQFVRDERRRELCFENGMRWFDLRRYGMPRLEHVYYASHDASPETYVLEQGDKNYTLELPSSELGYNGQVQHTARRVNNPQ